MRKLADKFFTMVYPALISVFIYVYMSTFDYLNAAERFIRGLMAILSVVFGIMFLIGTIFQILYAINEKRR